MNKSKYELPGYFAFYNAALNTYTNAVLGANALMLEYGVAATRTILRATALAAPAATATAPAATAIVPLETTTAPDVRTIGATATSSGAIDSEVARIDASLYADEPEPRSTDSTVLTQAAADLTEDSLQATLSPRPKKSKKAALRRRGGKN